MLCFRSRDYQLKNGLPCHLLAYNGPNSLGTPRSTAPLPTYIGISTMHHDCMKIIIRVALQELSSTSYIEIRCHCFRPGRFAKIASG